MGNADRFDLLPFFLPFFLLYCCCCCSANYSILILSINIYSAAFSFSADSFSRTFAGPGIGFGALTANRKSPSMPEAAIRTDIDQPLDIHVDFSAQSALDLIFLLDYRPNLGNMILSKILNSDIGLDAGLFQNLSVPMPDQYHRYRAGPHQFSYHAAGLCQRYVPKKPPFIPDAACAWDWNR